MNPQTNINKNNNSEIQESIEWLSNPQIDEPILQYETDFIQLQNNDILHENIHTFIEYYGVINKHTENKYIKEIRKLIFKWIDIENVHVGNISEISTQLFYQMSEIKNICSKIWFRILDALI